jgi:hypothetical protein
MASLFWEQHTTALGEFKDQTQKGGPSSQGAGDGIPLFARIERVCYK